jgi:hypothetical protein
VDRQTRGKVEECEDEVDHGSTFGQRIVEEVVLQSSGEECGGAMSGLDKDGVEGKGVVDGEMLGGSAGGPWVSMSGIAGNSCE